MLIKLKYQKILYVKNKMELIVAYINIKIFS